MKKIKPGSLEAVGKNLEAAAAAMNKLLPSAKQAAEGLEAFSPVVSFSPMLASPVGNVACLRFPLLGSYKIDGFRAIVRNGVVMSRNLKPISNRHVQALFGKAELEGFDGELIVGDPTSPTAFRNTSSGITTPGGRPAVVFHVFDIVLAGATPFEERLALVKLRVNKHKPAGVRVLEQGRLDDQTALNKFEARAVDLGYEGVMLRDPRGLYKYGRSTFREHGLMKLKRFEDAEATIIGFEEMLHNGNELKTVASGLKERSSKKEGMVGKGTLGAIRVVGTNGTYKGVEFRVGTGFNDELRALIWANKDHWLGKLIKYKFFTMGSKDAPRFPVYLGKRHPSDA
jgi:DNA ligase-1